MVHEKYIKRGDKVFGPYLYQNYRENGITKTRYLGVGKKKTNKKLLLIIIFSVFFLILFFSFSGLLFGKEKIFEKSSEVLGEIASFSPFKFLSKLFISISPINVFVEVVSNFRPEILNLPDEILVCENRRFDVFFNVSDKDGDDLTLSYSPYPGFPLFFNPINPIKTIKGGVLVEARLYSSILYWYDVDRKREDNQGWATYIEDIVITDGKDASSAKTNITIIEVNNPPEFNIGTHTIWTKGDENIFYYDLGKILQDNGEETPTKNLTFNLTYVNNSISPFNISALGIINIAGNESFIASGENSTVYDLKLCVNDTGLVNEEGLPRIVHQNISICGLYGYGSEPRSYCDIFTLTVTKENRAPIITSYNPINLNFTAKGNSVLYFNLTAYDPDWNPVDVYWYVDDVSEGYYEGLRKENVSKFEKFFACGISGEHIVKAVVTDGLLNASVQWNLSVEYVECPKPQLPGGGGGGGRVYCEEKWGCEDWMQCQNLNKLVEEGWTSKETELLIKERCEVLNYTGEFCGFQTRICTDFNYCKTEFEKPPFIRECYYTEKPTCTDGIKNCHDGACEVLVDCGGPCLACPTCNDKIQNQGEERVDCGGPCEPCKELPFKPALFKSIVSYSLIALLILVLVLVIREVKNYYLSKKRAEKESVKSKIKQEKKTYVYRAIFIIFVVLLLFIANIYVIRFIEMDKIASGVSKIGEGFLASYGFIRGFIRSLGIFLIGGPFVNENSMLIIWDDTNDMGLDRFSFCQDYCEAKNKPSPNVWTTHFYANYSDKNNGQPLGPGSGATCFIQFQNSNYFYEDNWQLMNFSLGLWEYSTNFTYKGNYNFMINCTFNSISNTQEDDLLIKNTIPYILKTAQGYLDFDKDGDKNKLFCFEDTPCYFDFVTNVSEDDSNDIPFLVFSAIAVAPNPLTDFQISSSTGIFIVNVTNSIYTGNGKTVRLGVQDNESSDSAILEVNIQDVNDAPMFLNLENKTLLEGDLFEYVISVTDEENNKPFKFNISFVNCSVSDCDLFKNNYTFDEINGKINISFIPTNAQIGSYIINFSVMDNSSLGNKTTSQIVNFSVNKALWKSPLALEHFLIEDEEFYLNLSENVTSPEINFSFIKKDYFSSFNLTSNGIINFTPIDEDVGFHEVEIVASDSETSSSKTFKFNVSNVNDNVSIDQLQAINANKNGSDIIAYENANVMLELYVRDDDFLIPESQKNFYNESLTINLTIKGPNGTLFNFAENGLVVGTSIMKYVASFTPRNESVGSYNITINVTDKSNSSDVLRFNLTIVERDYDVPVINYPDSSAEFNLKEKVSSELIFSANHTVGDNLTYRFYINDELRNSSNYYGDGRNFSWQFTPSFTDETYDNETKNLTLVVLNPLFPEINTSRTWNLTINHTNAPPQLIRDIGDKVLPYNYAFEIDLKQFFYDIDHEDSHYLQNVSFIFSSNSTPSYITISQISENWTFVLSSSKFSPFSEMLNITACDLNETGENMTCVTSNNFIVEFIEPPSVPVPTPVPTSGGGATIPIALKIIMPGRISAYEHEKIVIPLQLVNSGQRSFNELTLSSLAFKDGNISKEVNTSLSKTYFKSLEPGRKEDLNLTVFFNTDKIGDYEILVNVSSKSPVYTDWGKIHINLQKINESQVREILVFTEEFIVENPQCIEIMEIVKEAKKLFEQGDYENAKIKSEQAIEACKESISQPSVPKKKSSPFEISLYLIIATLLALVTGLGYYFFKRRKIQKMKIQEIKLKAVQEAKHST